MGAVNKATEARSGASCLPSAKEGKRESFRRVIGVADFAVSGRLNEVLVTYALGSCIGLTLWDPVARVGGLIHCMLPLSRADKEKARLNPSMYVDTGVVMLLRKLLEKGAKKSRLIAKIAGASKLMERNDMFRIGERNYTVMRKVLWKNDILIDQEECGGSKPRTMALYLASGVTTIKSGKVETKL